MDTLVDDIAYTLGVDRSDLNVVAAAKGLVGGRLKLTYTQESDTIDCSMNSEVRLIRYIVEVWLVSDN